MELQITWLDFFKLVLGLILLFFGLKILSKIAFKLFRRNSYKRKFKKWIEIIFELYKPLALLTIVAAFVIINYKVHGVLILAAGIILFQHIKNYCSGILFKINPLIDPGVNLVTGEYQGEIEKLMPFGIIIKVEQGERFINYSTIDKQGFCVNQKVDGSMRKTLYLLEPEKTDEVMDLLFESPLIDFNQNPYVWNIPGEKVQQIQLTLENGAKIESVIDYLNQFNIKSSLTKQ